MTQVINPDNHIKMIALEELLPNVLELKKGGFRVCQLCAAYINEMYELSYTFANDGDYRLTTLRMEIPPKKEVPSMTEIFPMATFYENEMRELFGVNIQFIRMDYRDKLYRINEKTPFVHREEIE
ncbi:MAG: NADH-quinone oxidoreductase subunit C [Eubacteriaceae bacterium]|nr:NADH-quinone oxidoreductase subunit C [Eubacteriaceae bacterium]